MTRVSTAHGAVEAVVAHFLSQLPGDRLLNLGAGQTGDVAGGRFVVNVDHVPPAVRGAGSFVVADGYHLPFRRGAFTGALLKDVIEHVQDPIGMLREVRRVAVPDALLLLTAPRAIARAVWDDPTHIRGFTARALVEALRQAGWAPVGVPRRIGALPGAGRLGLVPWLEQIMRTPGLGHWFGTNLIVRARPQ
jgi:SAM-dependent methyltransferase